MIVHLTSTSKVVELNGVPARVWEGQTESGIPLHAFITRIAVHRSEDTSQFEAELGEYPPPRNPDVVAYPARLVL